MNTYTLEKGKKNQFQRVDSFLIEWDLNINRIKRVYMTAVPEGDGAMGSDIIFHFGENYYQKYDTFIIERTRQQIIVLNRPQRVRDNDWLIVGKLLDNSYDSDKGETIYEKAVINYGHHGRGVRVHCMRRRQYAEGCGRQGYESVAREELRRVRKVGVRDA